MSRFTAAFLAGLLMLGGGLARAADAPAGSWKLSIPGAKAMFLLALEQKSGKWTGELLGTNIAELGRVTFGDVAVSADSLRMSFKSPRLEVSFDGKLPADAKTGRIAGSLQIGAGGPMLLVHLEPSRLKTYDKYELDRETIEQTNDAQALADAVIDVLKQAGEKKAPIAEVRGWADRAFKSTEPYGLRWQRSVTARLARALGPQKAFAAVAVEYARKAERLLDESEDAAVQMDVLEMVVQVMNQAGKAEDARQFQTRLARLEEKDFADYAKKMPFKPDAFAGRKGKSDRAVLVELFTGAECPPCVAADVAFDALGKTYAPADVILLQYHVHIPGPDPLTNPDTMARLQYYGEKIEGTPTLLLNGKPAAGGGGPIAAARKSYGGFRALLEPLLEKNADGKIQLSATRQGADISIKAEVSDLAKTGESVRLRFVLVEDHVRYPGGNGQRYHHMVARSFPGGAKGQAMTKKSGDYTAKVNLDELRGKLNEYLDEFASTETEFPRPERPLSFKGLRVIAFIQDDAGNDVLQAAQAEVK
jgi:hypothetical protein